MSSRINRKRAVPVVPNSLDEMFRMGAVRSDDASSDISQNAAPQSLDELLRMGEVKSDEIAGDSVLNSASNSLDELFQKGTVPTSLDELMATGIPLAPSPNATPETPSDGSPQSKPNDTLPSVSSSDLVPPAPVAEQPPQPVQPAAQPQLPPQPPVHPQPQAAFPTVQTPDGLSVGTNNLRFFNLSNYNFDEAAEYAKRVIDKVQLLALQEIEGNAAMQGNMIPHFPGWQYKMNDTPSQQDLAFMWNPEAVDLRGDLLSYYGDEKDPQNPDQPLFTRLPLVGDFLDKKTGAPFRVVNVHLKSQSLPPGLSKEEAELMRQQNDALRNAQIAKLEELGQRLNEDGTPVLIVGDFNKSYTRGYKGKQRLTPEAREVFGPNLAFLETGKTFDRIDKNGVNKGSNLDYIYHRGFVPGQLGNPFEVETKLANRSNGTREVFDHDLLAAALNLPSRTGELPAPLSPDEFSKAVANTDWAPGYADNYYVLDALHGARSPMHRDEVMLSQAPAYVRKPSVYPWGSRFDYGEAMRNMDVPQLRQLFFQPMAWASRAFMPRRTGVPATPEETKNGTGNAFTGFSLRHVIPFISTATRYPLRALTKSFKVTDEARKGLAEGLKGSVLSKLPMFSRWAGWEKDEERPNPKIDWQPALPQPMNIEDAQNIEHWFAGPSDQEPYLKRDEADKRTPEEKWKDFLASDPENSGFDDMPEYEAEGKSPYIKTTDAPAGDPNFKPLLPVLADAARSTASGFNEWLADTAEGAGFLTHAAFDKLGDYTGLWDPKNANLFQDFARFIRNLNQDNDKHIDDPDSLLNKALRHAGNSLPWLASMAVGAGPYNLLPAVRSSNMLSSVAQKVPDLYSKVYSTVAGSAAQTMTGAGNVYKTARELGGTHEQAMKAAQNAALASAAFNLGANALAGPHGFFTAGRFSDNEWMKRLWGAERWLERSSVSPIRMIARASGFRWPSAVTAMFPALRASVNSGLRSYAHALFNMANTRAALQSSIPNRQFGGNPDEKEFWSTLLSSDSVPSAKQALDAYPAFLSGAATGALIHAPQIIKGVKEGWKWDKKRYFNEQDKKRKIINSLARREKELNEELISTSKVLSRPFVPFQKKLLRPDGTYHYELQDADPSRVDSIRQQLRDVRLRLRDAESSSPVFNALFPYKSSLASAHDKWFFGNDFGLPSRSPLELARGLAEDQWNKFLDYWDLQPKLKLDKEDQRRFKKQLNLRMDDEKITEKKDIDKFVDSFTQLPRSFRKRLKAERLASVRDAENAEWTHRLKGEKADYDAARDELGLANSPVKPKSDADAKRVKAILDRLKFEETPQVKDKFENINPFIHALADARHGDRQRANEDVLSRVSLADLPKFQHEVGVLEPWVERTIRQINDPKTSPKVVANRRETLKNAQPYIDAANWIYQSLQAREIFDQGTPYEQLLRDSVSPIQRLIYDIPKAKPAPRQDAIPDFTPAAVTPEQYLAASLYHALNADLTYAPAKRIFRSLKQLRR